jgi:hypothetical protein
MANLIIKPKLAADSFKMNDANSSQNTILTIEGQSDSRTTTAGRIIYGKGVNETKGVASQASAVITIDLATGTFFEHTLVAAPTSWKIMHLPALGTVAAWVVKITNNASKVTWNAACWTGAATSTYDNGTWAADGTHFATTTPVFHWAGGTDHVQTDTNDSVDIISFWTLGGATPDIYSAISGQAFAS